MPSDVEVLKRLAAAGVQLSAEQIAAALAGPPAPGSPGADGKLRVTTAQIAPGSAWMKANKAEWRKALAEGRVELVE
jgi:hypothetical protein